MRRRLPVLLVVLVLLATGAAAYLRLTGPECQVRRAFGSPDLTCLVFQES